MGPSLWGTFIDQRVDNLQEVLLTVGVNGLLQEFEDWLTSYGLLHPDVNRKLIDVANDYQRPDEDGAL